LLALVVAEGLRTEEELEEDHSNAPNVDFVRDLRAVLVEALWRLVPVSAHALGGQLYLLCAFVYDLAKAEVGDLDLSIMEDDILWLQVEVNDLLLALVEILEAAEDLGNYQLCFLFRNLLVLFQIEIQIRPRTQLKYGAKAVVVNFHGVVLVDDPPVVQVFVYLILPDGVLDVIVLDLLGPAVVEVVDLAGNFSAGLQVVCLVDFGVASLAKDAQDEVAIFEHRELILRVDAAVLGVLLVSHPLELLHVEDLFLVQQLQLFAQSPLFVLKDLQLELVDFLLLILVDVVVVGGLLLVIHVGLVVEYAEAVGNRWKATPEG